MNLSKFEVFPINEPKVNRISVAVYQKRDGIRFSKGASEIMETWGTVQVLINEEQKQFLVRKCNESDEHSTELKQKKNPYGYTTFYISKIRLTEQLNKFVRIEDTASTKKTVEGKFYEKENVIFFQA